jgi:hypothetical protein
MLVTSNEKLFSALPNFIALKPSEFARVDILESLVKNTHYPATLKCLALILNCEDGIRLAHSMGIESLLIEILCVTRDDETKTHVVMALRNGLTNKELWHSDADFPWQRLLALLVDMSFEKTSHLLQQLSIQALRIMSDVDVVKDRLCKVYRRKLRDIPWMTKEARELKHDLLQWLEYRNYYANEGNKYAKYFI